MEQQVILVNDKDEVTGTLEKMKAHQHGILHRAFSIFIFNEKGEMLLQRRAMDKYHSAGLWSNTCCSHPAPGQAVEEEAPKRLKEEMGFEVPLTKLFHFIYRTSFHNGLYEHEFDHVFAGEYSGPVQINTAEVMDYRFDTMDYLRREIVANPWPYTSWFRLAFPRVDQWWKSTYGKTK